MQGVEQLPFDLNFNDFSGIKKSHNFKQSPKVTFSDCDRVLRKWTYERNLRALQFSKVSQS